MPKDQDAKVNGVLVLAKNIDRTMACRLNWSAAVVVERTRDMFKTRHALHAVVLIAVVAAATPACAADGVFAGYSQNSRPGDNRVYDDGYKRGFEDGRHDARDRRPSDYSRHDEYRKADRNDRRFDARIFRDGFVAGYNDGYRRYARDDRDGSRNGYPQPGPDFRRGPAGGEGRFRSPAGENGYRDGYAQGRDDARHGDRNDPVRASRYRSGDHDYNGRYGPRDDYRREYREAFTRGYEQGYRETRRR
jgi:hypothetical protein